MQAAGDHRLWLAEGTLPGGDSPCTHETAQLATAALPLMQGLQYARLPGHCTASTALGLRGSHCSAAGTAHHDSGSADSVTGITLLQIFSLLVEDEMTLPNNERKIIWQISGEMGDLRDSRQKRTNEQMCKAVPDSLRDIRAAERSQSCADSGQTNKKLIQESVCSKPMRSRTYFICWISYRGPA